MNTEERIKLLVRLGAFMQSDDAEWQAVKHRASVVNAWFTPPFIERAANNIAQEFLQAEKLQMLQRQYPLATPPRPARVGLVMAGNIPMVGFHDLMSVFITGHIAVVKPSSKDDILIPFLMKKMRQWHPEAAGYLEEANLLKDCDAYIATGSNQSAVHFEYYFRNQPHIIRRNRTSVAILSGDESAAELDGLADDVHLFFGLGCRNVTKIYVPAGYTFEKLLEAFEKYHDFANHTKYKNNYDYNLALLMLNRRPYLTNGSILLVEDPLLFSRISQLHYEVYDDAEKLISELKQNPDVQAIVGRGEIAFGEAQCPGICQFADGVDTIDFLMSVQQKEIRKS